MEAQEVFDRVVTHLRKQGKKAQVLAANSDESYCAYRGEGGTSCAAGCLIEDNEYNKDMENTRFRCLLDQRYCPESVRERLGPHVNLIASLQSVHDDFNVDNWENQFKYVAASYQLRYVPPGV